MECWNADGGIISGDYHATPDINLVGFCPVTPQFVQLSCVQQSLISTRVSSSMFAKGQRGCVLLGLLLVRGVTAMSSGLYTRLCHTFLV